jgi:hypothetical protein
LCDKHIFAACLAQQHFALRHKTFGTDHYSLYSNAELPAVLFDTARHLVYHRPHSMAAPSRETFLLQQYFHIALPRDVPGKSDRNLFAVESALLERFIEAVKAVLPCAPLEHQPRVDLVRLALTTSRAINVEGKVDKNVLVTELRQLARDQALILYVTEQNCALFVYKILG